jgi:hypothetical protein
MLNSVRLGELPCNSMFAAASTDKKKCKLFYELKNLVNMHVLSACQLIRELTRSHSDRRYKKE